MSSWIDKYKKLIRISSCKHLILADRDNLFDYRELIAGIEEDGFQIIKAKDDLDVRVQFELLVRESASPCLIVAPASYHSPLPDLLQDSGFSSAGLKELFPKLDAQSLHGLGFNELSLLSNIKFYEELGQDATIRFLLENLYGVDFNSIQAHQKKESILSVLISVLIEGQGINEPVYNFLETLTRPHFPSLVSSGLSKDSLVLFLNEQWSHWINNTGASIDFNLPQLNKAVGFLVMKNYIVPVKVSKQYYEDAPVSLRIGMQYSDREEKKQTIKSLIDYFGNQVAVIQDSHDEWHQFSCDLGTVMKEAIALEDTEVTTALQSLTDKANQRFQKYLANCYAQIFTLSGIRKPFVVSRILDHIAAQPQQRKALIVLDGITLWQWQMIAEALLKEGISVKTSASLAYIPTITAWSRQAIFKGDKPDEEKDNSQEAGLFKKYWVSEGYRENEISFKRFSAQEKGTMDVSSATSILGIVCNDLDDIAHSVILGNKMLFDATVQWIKVSNFKGLLERLQSLGFLITITSDHGNVSASGSGSLAMQEKVGVKSRSKRHIRFENETLQNSFLATTTNKELGTKGLSVYLKDESAFAPAGTSVITHGGSHLLEVMIPFATL